MGIKDLVDDWFEVNHIIINLFSSVIYFTLLKTPEDSGINLMPQLSKKLVVTGLITFKGNAVMVNLGDEFNEYIGKLDVSPNKKEDTPHRLRSWCIVVLMSFGVDMSCQTAAP